MRRTAAVIVLGCAIGGCSSDASSRGPVTDAPDEPVVLTRGTVTGHPWTLTVSADAEGNLCMAVAGSAAAGPVGDGCGFGPPDTGPEFHDVSDIASASDGSGTELYFGPAPSGAVRVRFDSLASPADAREDASQAVGKGCDATTPRRLTVPITHRLPRWAGDGGWFVTSARVPETTCGYSFGAFLDRDGHRVANHRW